MPAGRNNWTDEKLFDRLLTNTSERMYWDNISELRKRANSDVFQKCKALITSPDPKFRKIAIDIVAQLGITPRPFIHESIKLFFDTLETETDNDVIAALLWAISHNNDKLSALQIEKICTFKNTPEIFIKDALVSALLGVDNPLAIATLIHLSEDKSANVRNWSVFGIGSMIASDTISIRKALWNRVNDKNEDTRFEAITGLANRKDERVISLIHRELLRGDYQGLLFDAIIALGEKQFLPILKEEFDRHKTNEKINPEWIEKLTKAIAALES